MSQKKENPRYLNLVLFLGSGVALQARVFLEWLQGASSAMCVSVDVFQALTCGTSRKGKKKNTER